jgi:hypothetical protein
MVFLGSLIYRLKIVKFPRLVLLKYGHCFIKYDFAIAWELKQNEYSRKKQWAYVHGYLVDKRNKISS